MIEIATRGSRSMLRAFSEPSWVKKTTLSPSSPAQTRRSAASRRAAASRGGRSSAPRTAPGPRRQLGHHCRKYSSHLRAASSKTSWSIGPPPTLVVRIELSAALSRRCWSRLGSQVAHVRSSAAPMRGSVPVVDRGVGEVVRVRAVDAGVERAGAVEEHARGGLAGAVHRGGQEAGDVAGAEDLLGAGELARDLERDAGDAGAREELRARGWSGPRPRSPGRAPTGSCSSWRRTSRARRRRTGRRTRTRPAGRCPRSRRSRRCSSSPGGSGPARSRCRRQR